MNFKNFSQKFRDMSRDLQKETKGIYNVTFNDKKAIEIKIIENIEQQIQNLLQQAVIIYAKGFHNHKQDKGLGAEHIRLHLEQGSEGEITIQELLNLGNSLREYINVFEEAFIDKNGAKIYEWQNEENVKFRAVADKVPESVATHLANLNSDAQIISFYSDRNLNQQMEFKNPKVKAYYENKSNTLTTRRK
ncbi:Uncharacterised protein [Helicobacter fennelliae]|uniref:Uncharacterized protein n=1 Tax=Helicobacter fennelliae TaxID=215 RepID=A0A2X3EIZ4_9HELI|nr:hypothetical protein [Helicobacter fennelliae]SQC36411.1 Uncharacterised protein [Helicobacter fennelliae]